MLKKSFLAIAAGTLLACGATAQAEEVRVLAAGAAKHILQDLAPGFERATGHRIAAAYDTVGAQRDRVLQAANGEAADVVVLSDAALQHLRGASKLVNVRAVPLGRVNVSLAVRSGEPVPDISDPRKLRQALVDAPTIAYADPARGATAGAHFARIVREIGIADQVAAKATVLPFGLDVIDAVAQGRYAMGVSQSSEITAHPGVQLVGALPAPFGQGTGYGAALAKDTVGGRALLDYLRSEAVVKQLRAEGFGP